jgi:hypothetical protein
MNKVGNKKPPVTLSVEDRVSLGHYDHIPSIAHAIDYIKYLEEKVKSLSGFAEGVNEALNSGDGTYKP